MAPITCPKCGFEQEGGPEASGECLRCGIIFARYVPPTEPPPSPSGLRRGRPPEPPAEESGPEALVRFYRVVRWAVLAAVVLLLVLILKPAPPPQIESDPQAPVRVERKLRGLRLAQTAGRPHELRLNEAELNSWLGANLALRRPQPGARPPGSGGTRAAPGPPTAAPNSPRGEPTAEEVQSTVSNLKIELLQDRLRAYLVFEFLGKDLSLLLEGKLRVEDGYLRLEPTRVKLGSLPVPQAAIQGAVERLFDSPQNREKFRLPPEIQDVRVENRELVVIYR